MLFLHYHQGHTAEEISRMTNQPRGTVLSLIHRAIAKLREAAASASASTGRNQWMLFFVFAV
jgi:RNA polymerase sigma-70 factor (ECF subfamily)